MSESNDEDMAQTVVVFYRDAPAQTDSEAPLDNFAYHIFDERQSWDKLLTLEGTWNNGYQMIGITQSAREVGGRHEQVAWFVPVGKELTTSTKCFSGKDWSALLADAVEWMNKHIAPHMLINISIFEDEHDQDAGGK